MIVTSWADGKSSGWENSRSTSESIRDPGSPVRGTCYGYEVRSELPLDYLREGSGDTLEVTVCNDMDGSPGKLIQEWRPPRFPAHARLYEDRTGYRLWVEGGSWFIVDPHEPRVSIVTGGGAPLDREDRIWGLPALLCFLARGDMPLHASAVEVAGRALLLAAPSRLGKTTLAAAFASAGYRVLSEDLSCVRRGPVPAVVPGPALLRVRRDVADAFDLTGVREVGSSRDRLHLSIQTPRGTCDPVSLAGVVLLNEGDARPRLEPVSGAEVVRNLWAVSFSLPTDEDRTRSFRDVAGLASTTRTWRLTRRLQLEDLRPTLDCLVEMVTKETR